MQPALSQTAGTHISSTNDNAFTFYEVGNIAGVPSLTGPHMLIDTIGSQLDYIKVGVVITVILDIFTYPGTNAATTFQYAGVYMNYTFYNQAQPIIQATSSA